MASTSALTPSTIAAEPRCRVGDRARSRSPGAPSWTSTRRRRRRRPRGRRPSALVASTMSVTVEVRDAVRGHQARRGPRSRRRRSRRCTPSTSLVQDSGDGVGAGRPRLDVRGDVLPGGAAVGFVVGVVGRHHPVDAGRRSPGRTRGCRPRRPRDPSALRTSMVGLSLLDERLEGGRADQVAGSGEDRVRVRGAEVRRPHRRLGARRRRWRGRWRNRPWKSLVREDLDLDRVGGVRRAAWMVSAAWM